MPRPSNVDSGSSGFTANEAAVLTLYDAGQAERDIVATTGLAPGLVRYVISTFGDTEGQRMRWNRNAIVASAMMSAAIAATGRCYS